MRKYFIIALIALALFLPTESVKAQQGPEGTPEGTCPGWLYLILTNRFDAAIYPIIYFADATKELIGVSGDQAGQTLLDCCVINLFGYFDYFSNLTPIFGFLSSILLFYILIMTLKAVLSILKWLKQIFPFLG